MYVKVKMERKSALHWFITLLVGLTSNCITYSSIQAISLTSSTIAPITPNIDSWCCQFESVDACYWNTAGWHSSVVAQPVAFSIPQTDGYYIWEEDSTTEIFSVPFIDLPYDSWFLLDYYFNTQEEDADNNYIQFSFESDLGNGTSLEIKWSPIYANSTTWQGIEFHSGPCGICNGISSCSGTFYIRTSNRLGNKQVAAIDNFRLNCACKCV